MIDTFKDNIPVLVAIIGVFGVVLAAFTNLINKIIELEYIKRKERFLEKMKDLTRLQETLTEVYLNSGPFDLSKRMNPIFHYLITNSERLLKISDLMSDDDLTEANRELSAYFSELEKFSKNEDTIELRVPKGLISFITNFSPWIVSRHRLISALTEIMASSNQHDLITKRKIRQSVYDYRNAIYGIDANIPALEKRQHIMLAAGKIFGIFEDLEDYPEIKMDTVYKIIDQEVRYPAAYLSILDKIALNKSKGDMVSLNKK